MQGTSRLVCSAADAAHKYYMAVNPVTGVPHLSLPSRRQVWSLKSTRQILAGDGIACASGTCGDGGPADRAHLSYPKGIAFDELVSCQAPHVERLL